MIKNDKIIEIDKTINTTLNNDDIIIEAILWVMPGLIDAHCHIGITEEKKGEGGMQITSTVRTWKNS